MRLCIRTHIRMVWPQIRIMYFRVRAMSRLDRTSFERWILSLEPLISIEYFFLFCFFAFAFALIMNL
jgi:hypothetical protein